MSGTWLEQWRWADLTAITGAPNAASDPWAYVRSDGITAVVYAGGGNVHELRLDNGWRWANLTALASAPAAYDPIGYVRGDGISAVAYVGSFATGSRLHELRLDDGWKWTDLTTAAGAPPVYSKLTAYVRSDGISTINYKGADGHVYDVRLDSGWQLADLTTLAGGHNVLDRPAGYVRGAGTNAEDRSEICELRLETSWQNHCFGLIEGVVSGYMPRGYVRADGISAIVYLGSDGHARELWLHGTWHAANLSALAGFVDPAGEVFPYNRSGISAAYLPMVRR
ncbi:MAG: hypothetical protein V1772_02245 [Chloroflexota bacterium]